MSFVNRQVLSAGDSAGAAGGSQLLPPGGGTLAGFLSAAFSALGLFLQRWLPSGTSAARGQLADSLQPPPHSREQLQDPAPPDLGAPFRSVVLLVWL